MTLTALILWLFMSFAASAQLYQTQGQATIENDDAEQARTKAIEDALNKALLVAGASVYSVQEVVNGLLTQDSINIRASGIVSAIELIDEVHSGNTIIVNIRADIYPQEKQCFAADFRKSVLLTKSHIINREQANIGEIYAIDGAAIKSLAQEINNKSQNIDVRTSVFQKTQFSRLKKNMQQDVIKELVMALASSSDSHYVLFSEIDELSFNQERTNSWQIWQQSTYRRNFSISFYLYEGVNGELAFQQQYSGSAPWMFNKREPVDINSPIFWQSEYGQMVNTTLAKAREDLEKNILCEQVRAKIVQVKGNTLTINIGSEHGLKVGDKLSLLHKNSFTSGDGHIYTGFNLSPFKIKITQVYRESAQAITTDGNLLDNIQINDLAIRDKF
jgi:archaellum component FlaF (FlaF/FlaG flagellin family)